MDQHHPLPLEIMEEVLEGATEFNGMQAYASGILL